MLPLFKFSFLTLILIIITNFSTTLSASNKTITISEQELNKLIDDRIKKFTQKNEFKELINKEIKENNNQIKRCIDKEENYNKTRKDSNSLKKTTEKIISDCIKDYRF